MIALKSNVAKNPDIRGGAVQGTAVPTGLETKFNFIAKYVINVITTGPNIKGIAKIKL